MPRYAASMLVPAEADDLCRRHLVLVDDAAPSLITGLYLTGSVALGDFCPAVSDIDFVATVSREPSQRDIAVLGNLHAEIASQRLYDGFYLGPAGADSGGAPSIVARAHDGTFSRREPDEDLSPVAWFELSRYGLVVRGAEARTFGEPDVAALRSWLLGNLAGYWMTRVAQVEPFISGRDGEVPTYGETVSWFVLGPPRLHATLLTGRIISKTAAADHVAEHFPAWTGLADRCRRHRHGATEPFVTEDLLDAFRLTRHIRERAESRWR
jgi:hypothetical protein